jgi:Protein of unknown function (DUF3592)
MIDQATKEKIEIMMKSGRRAEAMKLLMETYNIDSSKADGLMQGFNRVGNTVNKASATSNKIFGYLLGPIGILLLIFGGYKYYSDQQMIARSTPVTGKVIELKESVKETTKNGTTTKSVTYAPVIEYSVNGKPYTYQSSMYSNPPAYELNGDAPLLVDPNDPSQVIIDSFIGRYLLVLVMGGLGLILSIIGIKSIFGARKF